MNSASEQKSFLQLRNLTELEGRKKHIYSLLSFLIVVALTLALYLVPDYYFLEKMTNETVFGMLELYQFEIEVAPLYNEIEYGNSLFIVISNLLSSLDGHGGNTPVIKSITASRQFAIVRACTGMQAGALLMALIIVTPAPAGKKIKASIYSLLALIIGNFLRIALVIAMTITIDVTYGATYDAAWFWAHDVLGKPIGFFGTILFAIIIERQGVPILNTVSLWLDSFIDFLKFLADKVFGSKSS